MSVSLYWTAYRDDPLSPAEEGRAQQIVDAASDDLRIVALVESEGTAWEGLTLWPDPDEDDDVLRGSSALAPRLSPAAAQALLDHCCQALTALRRDVPGAEWDVALDHVPSPGTTPPSGMSRRPSISSTTASPWRGRPGSGKPDVAGGHVGPTAMSPGVLAPTRARARRWRGWRRVDAGHAPDDQGWAKVTHPDGVGGPMTCRSPAPRTRES